jgi:hypothetical protein
MATLEHIKQSIQPRPNMKSIIFRPIGSFGFIELDAEILNDAFKQLVINIQTKSTTALDAVMLQLFMAHQEMT